MGRTSSSRFSQMVSSMENRRPPDTPDTHERPPGLLSKYAQQAAAKDTPPAHAHVSNAINRNERQAQQNAAFDLTQQETIPTPAYPHEALPGRSFDPSERNTLPTRVVVNDVEITSLPTLKVPTPRPKPTLADEDNSQAAQQALYANTPYARRL
jgi:hypothetical protein